MQAASSRPPEEAGAARPPRRGLSGYLRFDEAGIVLAVVLFFLVGAFTSPYFATFDNLAGILQSMTFLGFLAVGVGLALIAGEIDISVGSIYGLSSIVTALLLHDGFGVPVAIAGGLATGLACGLVNGVVAQIIDVPAIVVTLATLGVYLALALVLAGGSPVGARSR